MSTIPININRNFINHGSYKNLNSATGFVKVEIKYERLQQLLNKQQLCAEDIHCPTRQGHKQVCKMLLNCLSKKGESNE